LEKEDDKGSKGDDRFETRSHIPPAVNLMVDQGKSNFGTELDES
jgi:hypothetical protein